MDRLQKFFLHERLLDAAEHFIFLFKQEIHQHQFVAVFVGPHGIGKRNVRFMFLARTDEH